MLKRPLIESFDKYVSLSGGDSWRIVSPLLAGVACFALGVLWGCAYKHIADPVPEILSESTCEIEDYKEKPFYPVNSMRIKDVATLIDIECTSIKRETRHGLQYEESAAISSMQIVNALVSPYRYYVVHDSSVYKDCSGGLTEKGWRLSAGLCGEMTYIMMDIMKDLHIPAREIQFWHIDGTAFNHIACEIFYSGSWHYFDPTWGLYFRDSNRNILSLEEILELPKEEAYSCLVMDYANIFNSLWDFKTNPCNLLETDAEIGVAGNATISIDFDRDQSLAALPRFIGITSNWNGENCENKYIVISNDEIEKVIIYYDWCSLSRIDFKDEDGYCIKSVDVKDSNGKIELDENVMSYGAVAIETHNKEMPNYLAIKKIEAVYEDETRKILE